MNDEGDGKRPEDGQREKEKIKRLKTCGRMYTVSKITMSCGRMESKCHQNK